MAVAPLLTAAAVRARKPTRLKPADDPEIERLVLRFGEIAEDYLGVACPPREDTWTAKPRCGWLDLPWVQILTCEVVDENDNAVTVDEIDARRGRVKVSATGLLTATATFGIGTAATEEEDASADELYLSACATYVERMISVDKSGAGRDTLLITTDAGTTRYSTPNKAERRPTGFLQVDNDLNALHDYTLRVF